MTIPQQLLALSRAQLRERAAALLGPVAAKKTTAEQRDALAAYYEDNPQLCRSLRAPKIDDDDYDEILTILRGLPWDRLSRRGGAAATRLCAPRESFVMGGVLGPPGFHGFREKRVGRYGYNDEIVPAALAKQSAEVLRLWEAVRRVVRAEDPSFEYSSVQVNRGFRGAPHRDRHDKSYQYALSLGSFEGGGRLMAETGDPGVIVAYDTRGRLTRLDGRRVHWVQTYAGERFSLIVFDVLGPGTPVSDETNAREDDTESFSHHEQARKCP